MAEQHRVPDAYGQVFIDAAPEVVYQMISDPVGMVEFAPEVYRVRWLDGAERPGVGARFRGDNRKGLHRWWTISKITELVDGRRLAYAVRTPFWVPIALWRYDVEPCDGGCTVTESAWIRVPIWFAPIAILITGSRDRAAANTSNIATTLRALKRRLESPVAA